jgi:hypothetical protein
LRIAVSDYGVGQALQQRIVEIAVPDLDLHREAADIADTLDRGRGERERHGPRHGLQGAIQIPGDRLQILSLLPEALVPVIEDHESDAGIGEGCKIVQYGNAADGNDMIDTGHFLGDPRYLLHDRVGTLL